MRDVAREVLGWLDDGHKVAVARVIDVHGFGAVPAGELLAFRDDGERAGSVLRGVADPVLAGAVPVALGGSAVAVSASVGDPEAVAAGLACAGSARLLVHPAADRVVWAALADGRPAALATALPPATSGAGSPLSGGAPASDGPPSGSAGPPRGAIAGLEPVIAPQGSRSGGGSMVVVDGGAHGSLGSSDRDSAVLAAATELLGAGAPGRSVVADALLDAWPPTPVLVTVGGGLLAAALADQAGLLGWGARDVRTVADAVAAVESFGPADVLVLLDHDPAMDAVLLTGLRHGRGFLGALGSRRTQATRAGRLFDQGLTDDELAGLHGPVGLDIGARSPAETAVSIVAEVIAVRAGRTPAALRDSAGSIHP